MKNWWLFLAIILLGWVQPLMAATASRPNVLFIAFDDLNDWTGFLGGHPQAKTPNLDRFAQSGVLFRNAHCAAPACNPSRSAIFSGVPPYRSGLYQNQQKLRDVLPDATLLPKHFSNNGYWSAGSGKMLHYIIDPPSWDEYYPDKEKDTPFPRTFYPKQRPVSLPVGGPWQYVETDWAALDVTDEEYGGDWLVTKWIGEQLQQKHDKPFFLACGIYRPHEPWFVPKKYFEPFPLESIQPGPGYLADDLNDVPPAGQKLARNRYFEHIQLQGQWKQGIQAYLASIYFADAMFGRVMEALDKSPYRDNTIVVVWSDHGWQLGEKEHWQKFTGWRMCTRVPLIIRVPKNVPGLPVGTSAGGVCDRPVSLLSLYRTLTDLCGLPAPTDRDASQQSLVPLLKNPAARWTQPAITQLHLPNAYAVSAERWRFIHYAKDQEELYDISRDPYEWTNLLHSAVTTEHRKIADGLRSQGPTRTVPLPELPIASLPKLDWHPVNSGKAPASKPDGNQFEVVFINRQAQPVELLWMTPEGDVKSYGKIAANKQKRMNTRPGAVWQLRSEDGKELGHFIVRDRASTAIIPGGVE